jgi:serine/threonine protein phosphatase PrpC
MTNNITIACCDGIWNSQDQAGVNDILHESVAYGLKNLPVEPY